MNNPDLRSLSLDEKDVALDVSTIAVSIEASEGEENVRHVFVFRYILFFCCGE
jgi:hypothetical protein